MYTTPVFRKFDNEGFLHLHTGYPPSSNSSSHDLSSPIVEKLASKTSTHDSVTVNQGIYEEVLLTSNSYSLTGSKESAVLYFMHRFFSLYASVPKEFLSELHQAAQWAEKMETVDPFYPEKAKTQFNALVSEILSCIQGLRPEEGCILPGGTAIIFRLLKNKDASYTLMPFSRSPDIELFEHVTPGSRAKTRRVMFENLSSEDLDDFLIRALLSLSHTLPKHSIGKVNALFDDFKQKIVYKKTSPFHLSKSSICRFQNIWDMLQEGYIKQQTPAQQSRQKLELQIKVFCEYFEYTQATLAKNSLAFKYLQEGFKVISRNILWNTSQGCLNEVEVSFICDKLMQIEEALVKIEQKDAVHKLTAPMTSSPFPIQIKPVSLHNPKPPSIKSTESIQPTSQNPDLPTPYVLVEKEYGLPSITKTPFSAGQAPDQLDGLLALLKRSDLLPLQREQAGVDFCLSLPLEPKNKDDVWNALTPEERIKVSQKLTDISTQLLALMNLTGSDCPNRLLALTKIALIGEHLARLNGHLTNIKQFMFCQELLYLVYDLINGSAGYSGGFTEHRTLLGHSGYAVYSLREENVLMECKGYYEWLGASCKAYEQYVYGFFNRTETAHHRVNDQQGKHISWGDKQYERHEVELDLTKKQYKDNVQCQQLQKMLDNIRSDIKANDKPTLSFYQSYMTKGNSYQLPLFLAGSFSRWGKPIKNPLLLGVFYACHPEEGKLDAFSVETNTFTQEAIMDDPWLAIERAYISWQLDLPAQHPFKKKTYQQIAYTAKPELLQDFTENDLKDLLIALEPASALWNMLGLIKKNPVLLKNSDFQAIVERMIFQPGMMERTLKIDKNLPEFLGSFFDAHIKQFERVKENSLALFMVHLYHAIVAKFPPESLPGKIPNYKTTLHRWYNDSLKPQSDWTPYRYAILSELLMQIGSKKQLAHHELKDLAVFYGIWENTPPLNLFDSIQADTIRKQYFEWLAPIEQALKDSPVNLLQHIMEEMASLQGLSLDKKNRWEGTFPIYRSIEWEYNFASGSFTNLLNESLPCAMPASIVNDPLFQEAYPNFSQELHKCTMRSMNEITYYHFQDSHGIKNLIEKTAEGMSIYKSHPQKPTYWLQYVSLEKKSLNELGLLGANNRFYISPDNPNQLFLFNIKGEPEFCLDMFNALSATSSEIRCTTIRNLHLQRSQNQGLQAALFNPELHKGLNPLLNLAKASEILLWNEYGYLKKIEIYGLGLVFEVDHDKLVCETKPFKGYKLDLHNAAFYLPAGLLLLPPNPKANAALLILPHFSGEYVIKNPEAKSNLIHNADKAATLLWNAGKSYMGYASPAVESASASLWNAGWSSLGYKVYPKESASVNFLQWKSNASSKEFWSFSVQLPDLKIVSLDDSQSYTGYFDLFKYILRASQANISQAIPGAKDCLRKIGEMPSGKIAEKDIEAFAAEITSMASKRSKISAHPHIETVALALQGLLVLKDYGTPDLRNKIAQHISKLVPLYFTHGRQINLKARLDDLQELSCLLLMKTYNVEWFSRHAPLLKSKKEQMQINPSPIEVAQHSERIPPPALKMYNFEAVLFFKPVTTLNMSLFKQPEDLAEAFMSIYELARNTNSSDFQAMHKIIKKLKEQTFEKEDVYEEIGRLTGRSVKKEGCTTSTTTKENFVLKMKLYKYLEAIFYIQSTHPRTDLPKLENHEESTIETFCKQLTNWVANNLRAKKEVKEPPKAKDMSNDSILEELTKHFELPINALTLETGLEKKLSALPIKPLKLPSVNIQKGDSLFSTVTLLNNYFIETKTEYSFDLLSLDKIENDTEPSVRMAAKNLLADIGIIKNTQAVKYKFKDIQAVSALKGTLEKDKSSLLVSHETLKEAIEKSIHPTLGASNRQRLKSWAGYDAEVQWDELYVAFLQDNLDSLSSRLPKQVDLHKLKSQLFDFFKIDITIKTLSNAINQLIEFQEDTSLLSSSNASSKIFELLSRERCFDPAKYPELLAMESLFGFMVREDQLKMVIDFINNPHCIRQAATGAGKTNAILPLVALMKANGSNLVSLKFLDTLFNESCERLQKLLGTSFQKKIFPLLFSGTTPLTFDRVIHGKNEKQSIFKLFYEEAIKTILNKGCLITNKRSLPLLKAKMIEIYDRLSQMDPKDRPVMDLEHLLYLGKLLCLFKDKEESLYDEFDKFLSAREELHLRIGQGKPLPGFVADTLLNIYDLLIHNPVLNLKENAQAELPLDKQREIIKQTAELLDDEWQAKKGISVKNYFIQTLQGTLSEEEEKAFLKTLDDKLSLKEKDILCLQRDLLTEYFPSTLFRSADQRYIRSKMDEKSVIPCDYADLPKEGSEFEDIRVKLCYLIQYYNQKGPSFAFFNQWVNGLKSQAMESLIAGEEGHITKTSAEKIFKDYFPNASLEVINKDIIKQLYKEVKTTPALIRKFLKVLTQEQKLPGKKISLNPHNQVSIAKASAGTSATKGCLAGLHRGFIIDDKSSNSNALMIFRLLQRINPKEPFLSFNQKSPKGIIAELLIQDKKIKVVIDGAGALRGMPFDKPAKQLLEKQPELTAAGYFDHKGKRHCLGNAADFNNMGLIYSNSQARGADAALNVHHKAVLLVNGRSSQEEISQNEGRLRKEDQKLKIAVPEGSPIKNVGDLINATLSTEAQTNSLDLFLSKQQEMHDLVHDQMCITLAKYASQANYAEGFKTYKVYAPHQMLVSEFAENWEAPGSYYNLHKYIRRTKDSVKTLELVKQKYIHMAKSCQLALSQTQLEQLDLEKFRPQLPLEVTGDMKANQEVQIETENQTEVQTEIETAVDIDIDTDKPTVAFYLPWRWDSDYSHYPFNTLQPAYEKQLEYTSNFLPLARNANAPSMHHRRPHDPRQNRLQYVEMRYATAADIKDVSSTIFSILKDPKHQPNVYDTRLNRYIAINDKYNFEEMENKNYEHELLSNPYSKASIYSSGKKNLFIAQLRFEDGQFKGYTPDEWKALTWWLREQPDPAVLEDYFIHDVLRYRPQDRERYLFSPLHDLFQQIKMDKAN